jgi:hypothetical protein
MITWTDSARAALENHNFALRQHLVASGADPDEVAGDLRRHIEEELMAARIAVATKDDVQRILAKMGPPAAEDQRSTRVGTPRRKGRTLIAVTAAFAVLGLGYVGYRLIHPHRFIPLTGRTPAEFDHPYRILITTQTPGWGQFRPGDTIVITSVTSDRKDIEVGGRYRIEGTYTLASMESAGLSVSVTAPSRDSPGAVSPGHPEEGIKVQRGSGTFSLGATMRYPGSFHVSFNPAVGGESLGTVYFTQADPSASPTTGADGNHGAPK